MKLGAFDFIRKETLPFNLKVVVDAALKAQAEMRAATTFKPQLTVEDHQDSIVGKSAAMQQVFKMIGRVSHSDAPVMITGESGSGKELVARAIHHYSQRSAKSFVAINCAAIPEQLLESELFGHEKGSFTGATGQRVGRFEQSHGGTLFLDEIGDMPLSLQSKILRVLQDGEFSRVGGNDTLKSDVRIVAATNKNLEQEVAERTFPRRSFLPAQRRAHPASAVAPAHRGHPAAGGILSAKSRHAETSAALAPQRGGRARSRRLFVAGQCPRTREHDPARLRARHLRAIAAERSSRSALTPRLARRRASQAPHRSPRRPPSRCCSKQRTPIPNVQLLPWLEREFTLHAMKVTKGNQVRAAKLLGITRATLRKRIERFGITKELTIS